MKTKQFAVAALIAIVAALAIPVAQAAILEVSTLGGVAVAFSILAVAEADLFQSKKLRQERGELVEQNRALLERIGAEKDETRRRELETEWDKRDADIVRKTSEIARAERQEQLASEAGAPLNERRSGREMPEAGDDHEAREKQYSAAFRAFLKGGKDGITAEQRAILEKRAQTVTTTGGGYLIPTGFSNQLETAMLDYSGILEAPTMKMRTDTGNDLPWPTVNDTSNKGALLGINTQESEQTFTFGVVTFNAYKFTSKNVLVPIELMQDSAFNLDAFMTTALAERLGRILNQYGTTGTGSSQPNGIVTASTAGVTGSAAASITIDDIIDLKHSVDPAYRKRPSSGFMFNDSTLKALKKLKDSENRALWQAGYAVGEPDTIDGSRYYINQDMAAIGASAKSVLFGDLGKFVVRTVQEITMMRLVERYADYYQIAFQAWMRADTDLLDAGTRPIKHLVHQSA